MRNRAGILESLFEDYKNKHLLSPENRGKFMDFAKKLYRDLGKQVSAELTKNNVKFASTDKVDTLGLRDLYNLIYYMLFEKDTGYAMSTTLQVQKIYIELAQNTILILDRKYKTKPEKAVVVYLLGMIIDKQIEVLNDWVASGGMN